MRECNMVNGQDIFRSKRWWTRVEFACGRVIRAHGPDIFESSRRIDLIHSRLCNDAAAVTRFPETEGETMSEWTRVLPNPKPVIEEEWKFELPDLNQVTVTRVSDGWWCHAIISGGVRVQSEASPFREALESAAGLLERNLDVIRKMLIEHSPQVDFPAAVDPVAALERGEG